MSRLGRGVPNDPVIAGVSEAVQSGGGGGPPPPPPPGNLVNHWVGDLINAPGQCQVAINGQNTAGNALVAFIGWNDYTFPNVGTVSVADDQHNYWQPLEVNTQTTTELRGAIWIATNADPCNVVCVSASWPVSSMAVEVCEFSLMPPLVNLDLATSAMAINNTAGFSGVVNADWVFSLLVSGNNTDTISTSGGFTALPTVAINDPAGAGGPADITLTPMYLQTIGGTATVGYSSTGIQPLAHTLAAIFQTSNPVTNTGNPNFPVFQVFAAFGAQVGAGTTNFTWTDITSRAIHDDGTILDAQKGRSYELTGPESGTIQLWLNNQDGALTPGNASSPYYPNVLPQTPIKVIATWNNEIYNVAYGYMDKWPQSFGQDMPQWGFVNSSASDAMGVLANLSMFSALQSEVLFDNPYAYWPLNDSYGDANGLPFTNLGQGISNTKPMIGVDGQSTGAVPLSTGLALNLQGDTGTGIGLSGLTANQPFWSSGAICVDPGLPQINGAGAAMTIEFWASMPTSAPTVGGAFETPLVSLLGPSTNFGSGGGASRVRITAQSVTSTTYAMGVRLTDYTTNAIGSGLVFALPNDGNTHHHVFTIQNNSGTWTFSHYLDGVFDHSYSASTALNMTADIYEVALGPAIIVPLTQNPYNYTIGHVALYSTLLNPQRIKAHYQAGAQGFNLDTDNNRFARIMAWSNTHVPNAALGYAPAPLMGPAFSVGSQAATDAINDLIVSTGGYPYADGSGTVWWVPRTALYNRAPKWVLSDNPADSGYFYDPAQAFDFDNSYLFIQNTVTRVLNQTSVVTTSKLNGVNSQSFQNTGAIVTLTAPGAQAQYGNRNALSQSILTSSDQDVYDRNQWSLAKYSSSSLRVPSILVDAASNPAQWPFVLGAEQGDIVQVKRTPLGGAPYVVTGIIVNTHLQVGVNQGQLTVGIVPYNLEANVLQVGIAGFDTLNNGIGW